MVKFIELEIGQPFIYKRDIYTKIGANTANNDTAAITEIDPEEYVDYKYWKLIDEPTSADIVKAHNYGARIEYKRKSLHMHWVTYEPEWNWDECDYRIKKEDPEIDVITVNGKHVVTTLARIELYPTGDCNYIGATNVKAGSRFVFNDALCIKLAGSDYIDTAVWEHKTLPHFNSRVDANWWNRTAPTTKTDIMLAFQDGAPIEYRSFSGNSYEWLRTDAPAWNWSIRDYRVAIKYKLDINDVMYEVSAQVYTDIRRMQNESNDS